MTARKRSVVDHKQSKATATDPPSEKTRHLSPATVQACSVLTIAVVVGVLWNWVDESIDPGVHRFLKQICNAADDSVFCHPALIPSRRTQRATRKIKSGEVVLVVPRHLQLWDLDALRDPFIRKELLPARLKNGDALPNAAFLAAFLALKRTTAIHQHSDLDPILRNYLTEVLPTYNDYASFHPILWTEKELASSLGLYSSTFSHVMSFRTLVNDEYDAFTDVSAEFLGLVNRSEYLTARLHVLTRSFGTGPLPVSTSDSETPSQLTASEIEMYKKVGGLSLERGSHAMVPVLDLYDHHASPNVGFSYDNGREGFVISAISNIAPGFEVMDSYGKRTDSDLFARYGFVNGDGSEWTQASIALWHSVQASGSRHGLEKEKPRILRYLQYDDGYENCVDPRNEVAWEFKKWKFAYLMTIAGKETHWIAQMSPRDKNSEPGRSTNKPITLDPPPNTQLDGAIQFDATFLFGSCRLISLTHLDYKGNATEMLKDAMSREPIVDGEPLSFALPPTSDALEYRTQMCVARMASTVMARLNTTLDEQRGLISRLNKEAHGTRKWTVEHVRYGELQTLETLKQVAFSALRITFGEKGLNLQGYLMTRRFRCETSHVILNC